MPAAGILVAAGLAAFGYLYVGKPIGHAVVRAGHAIAHTAGKVAPHKHKPKSGGADQK